MAKLEGQILRGQYRIEELVGRGGMAEVYRAFDLRRSYPVAVKIVRADLAEDIEFVRRFRSEAKNLSRLAHENIVRFYEFAREGHLAFLVMDFVEGVTLRRRILDAEGPLPLDEVLNTLRQVCAALHYAHEEGIIHRDVKPGNIMVRPSPRGRVHDQVLVADFGIAKVADSGTMTAVMPGTPAYMSPEQCRSQSLDRRTDVYAVGILGYEMLTGRRPFRGMGRDAPGGTTRARICWEKLHTQPELPRMRNPSIPPHVEQAILHALAKNPANRPPTARALYHELDPGGMGAPPASTPAGMDVSPAAARPEVTPSDLREDAEGARLYGLAREAMVREEWDRTIEHLNALLAVNPDYPDTIALLTEANRQKRIALHLNQAQAAFAVQDWAEAIALSAEVIATDPQHADARALLRHARSSQQAADWYAKATSAIETGDWAAASNALEEVIAQEPSYGDARALLKQVTAGRERECQLARLADAAQQSFEDGQWDSAVQHCEELLALDPDHSAARELLERARQELETEHRAQTLFEQARTSAEQESWRAAAVTAEAALTLRPHAPSALQLRNQAQARLALADLYAAAYLASQEGHWLQAVAAWEDLLAQDPNHPEAADHLAEAKAKLAEENSARAHEAKVADLIAQALAFERAEDWLPATLVWSEVLVLAPQREGLGERLARAEKAAGKQQSAEALYREARAACDREDWASATPVAKQLVMAYPNRESYQSLLACCHEGLDLALAYDRARARIDAGQWLAARRILQSVLARVPGYKDADLMLAQVTESLALQTGYRDTESDGLRIGEPLVETAPVAMREKPSSATAVTTEEPLEGRLRVTLWMWGVVALLCLALAAVSGMILVQRGSATRTPAQAAVLEADLTSEPTLIGLVETEPVATPSLVPTSIPAATATEAATVDVTATREQVPTRTLTSTSSITPASTSTRLPAGSPTPVPTTTQAATRVSARTAQPSATVTPKPTLAPTRAEAETEHPVTPTEAPAAAQMQFPAPVLIAPQDGQAFTARDAVLLQWNPVGKLPADGYYVVSLAYTHLGETWPDETPWLKEPRWMLSEHEYLLDMSDDGRYRWSVQVMHMSEQNAQGKPTGIALSPMSAERTLIWRESGSSNGGPEH